MIYLIFGEPADETLAMKEMSTVAYSDVLVFYDLSQTDAALVWYLLVLLSAIFD
jgi:hypothetical protein